MIEQVVRAVDAELHPHSRYADAIDDDSWSSGRRKSKTPQCDWLRNEHRIECKSAQLSWNEYMKTWRVCFSGVKFSPNERLPHAFDDLLLALYTPRGIHVVRHDFLLGKSQNGTATAAIGNLIVMSGPRREYKWERALDAILSKFDSKVGCENLAFISW
eukprot:gnl/TRDRNA2_/TRDRNA2_122917_c0_seq1.p1 gnl/TRDRNA2_/TRDRNA2_122917_c0~~gnl/TRDRNA2_/TRDRNA2_122917_c0_seq1.p1  ORF type:complete len:174 (+),score=14.87 gnl/TRDRNA2_/TRDRNA2_122917_c0_seq1:46-522(+)